KIPMGTILGAMLVVGMGQVLDLFELAPNKSISFVVQIALGTMIGLNFERMNRDQFKKVAKSLLFIVISVIVMTITVAKIVSKFTNIDYSLLLLSSAPGGMVEMATMANALQLDAPAVIFLHFIRLLLVMLVFPYIILWGVKRWGERI